jgi:hypothetical protein
MPITAMQGGIGSFAYGEFTKQGSVPASLSAYLIGGGGRSTSINTYGSGYQGTGAGGGQISHYTSITGVVPGTAYAATVGYASSSSVFGLSGSAGGSTSSATGGSSTYSGGTYYAYYTYPYYYFWLGGGGSAASGGAGGGYFTPGAGGSSTNITVGSTTWNVASGGGGTGGYYYFYSGAYYYTGVNSNPSGTQWGDGANGPLGNGTNTPTYPGAIIIYWLTSQYPTSPTIVNGSYSTSGSYSIVTYSSSSGSITF